MFFVLTTYFLIAFMIFIVCCNYIDSKPHVINDMKNKIPVALMAGITFPYFAGLVIYYAVKKTLDGKKENKDIKLQDMDDMKL